MFEFRVNISDMKKFILFAIILLFNRNVFSQSPNWVWAKSATDSVIYDDRNSLGSKISADGNGNIYVAGNFFGSTMDFGGFTINGNCFLAKYDPSGNVIWAKGFGGGNINGISTDSNGNVIITGTFSLTLILESDTLIGSGNSFFLVKFNSSGTLLWDKASGIVGSADGNNITIDKNNNIYATGQYTGTASFGGIVLTTLVYNSMFIVKYDSSGNVIWAKTQQGGIAEGEGISHDSYGNIFCTGLFGSYAITFGSTTLVPSSPSNIFIVKLDSLGNFLWAKNGGRIANDNEGYHIATDSIGNSYVIGQYFNDSVSFDGIVLVNNGSVNDDFFIVKYDPIGNVIWAKSAGGINYDFANDIKTDKYGNIYVTGSFQNSSITFGTTTLNSYGTDLFIVKYNPLGNMLWARSSTGTSLNNNYSNGICTDNNGNVYIEGVFSYSNASFGSTVLNCSPMAYHIYDFFIAKLSQCTLLGTTISDTTCNVVTFNGETFYNSGNYIQTLESQAGCDSIINLNLTINPIDSTITQSSCVTYSLNGISYTNSGLYHQNYSSFSGCDSVYTLNLTIDLVNTNVNQTTYWVSSTQNGVQYQWVDCANNYALIPNDTNAVFYPSNNGMYAVIVTNPSGCFDTSSCYEFTNLSIANNSFNNSVSIYPNPFSAFTTIIFSEEQKNTIIKITDIFGTVIKSENFTGKELTIEKENMRAGIYFVQIICENKNIVNKKIVIQ